MAIPALQAVTANVTRLTAALWTQELSKIRTEVNNDCLFSDENKTISATYTFSTSPVFPASVTFALGITVTSGGITVSAGGVAVTGNSTVTGTLAVSSTLTAGNTSITGTLATSSTITSGGKLTVSAGGMETTGNVSHHDGTFIVGTSVSTISLTATTNLAIVAESNSITITSGGVATIIGSADAFNIDIGPTLGIQMGDPYIRPKTDSDMLLGQADKRWATIFGNTLDIDTGFELFGETVDLGANDSAGTGYRVVRVPNS